MSNTVIDDKEFAVAVQEALESTSAVTVQLSRPFTYEGETYAELRFDWDKLTGEDSLSIENELQAQGKFVVAPTFSGEYLVRMAARACTAKIGQDLIRALPISDYNRIRSAARSFLLRSES